MQFGITVVLPFGATAEDVLRAFQGAVAALPQAVSTIPEVDCEYILTEAATLWRNE